VAETRAYASGLGHKHLALEAERNNATGLAIGFLLVAKDSLKHGGKRAKAELKQVEDLEKKLRKVNDSVAFESIPSVGDVQSQMPSGREVLVVKEFKPPRLEEDDRKAADGQYAGKGNYY